MVMSPKVLAVAFCVKITRFEVAVAGVGDEIVMSAGVVPPAVIVPAKLVLSLAPARIVSGRFS